MWGKASTALLAFAAGVTSAQAQDQQYDWAGSYVGASFTQHRMTHDFAMSGISFDDSITYREWIGGGSVFGGYQWALPNGFIAGIEITGTIYDADEDQMDFESSGFGQGSVGTSDVTVVMASQLKWSSSLHARLGYAFDRVLLFASAGPSVGSARLWGASISNNWRSPDQNYGISDIQAEDDQTLFGASVSVGSEIGLTRHLSARLKFEHTEWTDYPELNAKLCYSCPIDKLEVTSSTQQWSIGVSYRF